MAEYSIVVFRRDLRVDDNPALRAAMASGAALAVYVLDDAADGRPLGGAARWWLHHALERLQARLAARGVPLVLRIGRQNAHVLEIAKSEGVGAVYWNRRYTPWGMAADNALQEDLRSNGIASASFAGSYLREPTEVRSKQGTWLRVFTPFHRASRALGEPPPPTETPAPCSSRPVLSRTETLAALDLLPTAPDWAGGLRKAWLGHLEAPEERLRAFLQQAVADYDQGRDRPDIEGTSALSPYLAFGELSPRQVWHAARRVQGSDRDHRNGVEAFLRQLVWRDFCANLLYHFPDLASRPFQPKFERFPWRDDRSSLRAWQRGKTGYPWIDAGMRQLWETGWMHNRTRMGVASFLTKHLLLPWQYGEAWFWDTLVDADPAQNIANWQWVAGCGADAAPYFRIFNPITQGDKFDKSSGYRRRWQPAASDYQPGSAGIAPVISHEEGRTRALEAFRSLSREQPEGL